MTRPHLVLLLLLSLVYLVNCTKLSSKARMGNVLIKPLNYTLSDPLVIQLSIFPNGMNSDFLSKCFVSIEGNNDYYSPSINSLHDFIAHKTLSFPLAPKKNDRYMFATDLPEKLIVKFVCGEIEMQREDISMETCIFAETILRVYNQAKSPLNIAVVGQLGAGKSTLANSMLTAVHKDSVSAAVANADTEHVTEDEEYLDIALWNNEKQDLTEPKITLVDTVGISISNYDREIFTTLFHGGKTNVFKKENLIKVKKEIEKVSNRISQIVKNQAAKYPKVQTAHKKFRDYNKAQVEFDSLSENSQDEKVLLSAQKKLKTKRKNLMKFAKDKDEDFTKLTQRLMAEIHKIESDFATTKQKQAQELIEKKQELEHLKEKLTKLETDLSKKQKLEIEKVTLKDKVHAIIFVVKKNIFKDSTGPAIKDIFKTVIKLGYNPIICVTHTEGKWEEERRAIAKFFNKRENELYEVAANMESKGKVYEVDKLAFEVLHKAVSRARDFVTTRMRRKQREEL